VSFTKKAVIAEPKTLTERPQGARHLVVSKKVLQGSSFAVAAQSVPGLR
jgi:hypothetical protein